MAISDITNQDKDGSARSDAAQKRARDAAAIVLTEDASPVGEALRQISLAGAAPEADASAGAGADAEDRLSPLAEMLGAEIFQHLDAESLCRLNLCARFFSEKDSTTRWSICEGVARERALDLMDGHMTGLGLCAREGVSSVRQLDHGLICAFLIAFYATLVEYGHRLFPHPPKGRPPIPKNRWSRRRLGFQGWFHILDALEAGPVADYAAARALGELAVKVLPAVPMEDSGAAPAVLPDDLEAICVAAEDAMRRARLARPGTFRVVICTHQEAEPGSPEDEQIAALLARNGCLSWSRCTHKGTGEPLNCGGALFPSLQYAIDARHRLEEDPDYTRYCTGMSIDPDFTHFFCGPAPSSTEEPDWEESEEESEESEEESEESGEESGESEEEREE